MRYEIYKINPTNSYLITIGSRIKPDSGFRERVQSDIDKAMGAFSRERGASHSLAILTDPDSAGSREELIIPEIFVGGQYLIFALFSSGDNETESREDLSENKKELERAFSSVIGGDNNPNDIHIGLVLLRDCSVNIIPVYSPSGPEFVKGWFLDQHKSLWLDR